MINITNCPFCGEVLENRQYRTICPNNSTHFHYSNGLIMIDVEGFWLDYEVNTHEITLRKEDDFIDYAIIFESIIDFDNFNKEKFINKMKTLLFYA